MVYLNVHIHRHECGNKIGLVDMQFHFLCSFLSSGFIGHLPNIKEMVSDWTGEDDESDQLFFTKIYIDPAKRVRAVHSTDLDSRYILIIEGIRN